MTSREGNRVGAQLRQSGTYTEARSTNTSQIRPERGFGGRVELSPPTLPCTWLQLLPSPGFTLNAAVITISITTGSGYGSSSREHSTHWQVTGLPQREQRGTV